MKKSLYTSGCLKAIVLLFLVMPLISLQTNAQALHPDFKSNGYPNGFSDEVNPFSSAQQASAGFVSKDAAKIGISDTPSSRTTIENVIAIINELDPRAGNHSILNNLVSGNNTQAAPPTITCPGNKFKGNDQDSCNALITGLSAFYTGNVTTLTYTATGVTNLASPPTGINNLSEYRFNVGTTTFTYTATDFDGISVFCSFTIIVFDLQRPDPTCAPDASITIPDCFTFASGVILVPPTIVENCGILSIINDAPAQFPVGPTAVTYNVFDINGLQNSCRQLITIEKAPAMVITPGTTPVGCFGGNDGTATATVTNGTPTYLYSWNTSPVQTTQTATGLVAGTYTVTVTDADGCVATANVTITEPLLALSASITIQLPVDCFGNSTGSVTVVGSGGTPPYEYSIDGINFQLSGTFANLPAGTYTITVRDANNCTFPLPVTITQPADALTATITDQTPVDCFGGANGSVTVAGSGGTPPYQYSINGVNFQVSGTFSNLAAGFYIVTVKDANNCTVPMPVTITQPADALSATITILTPVDCFGNSTGSVTVVGSGGTPPYQYSIDGVNFQASGTFSNLPAGSYIITVIDANNCSIPVPVNIAQPASALSGSIINQIDACFGLSTGSVTISGSGGTPPYQYSIDGITFQASGTFLNLAAGSYTITIRDANNCEVIVPVTILQPVSALSASILTQQPVDCFGSATGSVTVAGSGGTPAYQYSIDGVNFQASGTFLNLAAGTYTVTVRDANNCTFIIPVIIIQPATALTGLITLQLPVDCFGNATGSVTVAGSGGTPPYQYSIDGVNFQVSGTFSNLAAGFYIVTVKDANNCTVPVPVTIAQPANALTATITILIPVDCFGNSTGSVTVAGSGGTPPYQYSIDGVNFQASGTFSNLAAGSYIITVTDAGICSFPIPITITQPASALSASITNQLDACFGSATGSVTVTGSGGTAPYQYSIDGITFQASGTFSNLAAGAYTIYVTDANNCPFSLTVNILQPATALSAAITIQLPADCFGSATGSVTVAGSGGTPPYQYSIDGVNFQASGTFSNLAAGLYTITVRDVNNCIFTIPVTILQPASALSATITDLTAVLCFGDATGSVTVAGNSGTPSYQYSIDGITFQVSGTFSNLAAGFYIVTVKDANNCTIPVPVVIGQPANALSALITDIIPVDCFGNSSGSVTIAGSGGTLPYQYSIDGVTFQASGTFAFLGAGSYTVTVLDANNCTFPMPVSISQPASALSSSITNQVDACTGISNGTVTVAGSGGTPAYQYSIDGITFQASGTFGNLAAGSYVVTVLDANNCSYPLPVLITSAGILLATDDYYSTPVNTVFSDNVITNDLGLCFPPVTVTSNTAPANGSVSMLPDGTFIYTPNLNYIGPDSFTYEITDLNGITSTATVFITVNAANAPPVAVNESISLCQGTSFIGTVGNGGTVFNGDTDPENNLPFTVNSTPVAGPSHGVFVITDLIAGTYDYTPAANYSGSDTVVVSICDAGIPVACSNDTIFITVNPIIAANAGPGFSICNADATFLVGNNPAPGTGTWAFVSGPNTPVIFPPSGSNAIVAGMIASPIPYVFSYTIISSIGCISIDTMSIINYNPPTQAYAGIDQEICDASGSVTTNLQANTPVFGTGLWTQLTGPVVTTIADPADPNTSVSGFTTGTYSFQWTISNGICQVSDAVVNIRVSIPPTAYSGPDDTICDGSKFRLNFATASDYSSLLWSTTGNGIFDNPATLHPAYTPGVGDVISGSVTLKLTAYGIAPCPNAADEMVLNISSPPLAIAGPDTSLCQGSSFTVSGANAQNQASIQWTHDGAGTLSGVNTLTPTYVPAPAEAGVITLTLTALANRPCNDAKDQMKITILPSVQVSAGPDGKTCGNAAYLLAGASAGGYTGLVWSASGSGTFNDSTLLNPVYTPGADDLILGFVNLRLTAFANKPCGDLSDDMILIISRTPVALAGLDDSICQGNNYTLTGNTASDYSSLLWTTTGTGTLINETSLTPTYIPAAGETGIITMTITAIGNNPCGNFSDDRLLTIIEATHANAGPDATICQGSTFEVTGALADHYNSLAWTTSGTGTFSDATVLLPIYSPGISDINSGSVTLTLTAYGNALCPVADDQMTLSISGFPVANAGQDAKTCQGVPFTVSSATASNYSSILWTTTGAGVLTNETTLTPTYTPSADETGPVNLVITVYGNPGCGSIMASDPMTLIINEGITAYAGADKTIPMYTTTTLQGSASGGSGQYQYNWIPGNLLTFENTDNPTTLQLSEDTRFVLIVTDQVTGCLDTDTVNVLMSSVSNQAPVAVDDYDTTDFNTPMIIPILANDSDPENGILTISDCGFPANGFLNINSDGSATYSPYADFTGDDEFCYIICDNGNPSLCDSAIVYVHVNPEPNIDSIFVYNGFSPNGDGNNDHLVIKGIEFFPNNEIVIYNRYGDKIRELSHYDNHTVFWDGSNIDGKPIPDGTYFYILKINDATPRTGWIFIRGKK